MPKTAKLLKHAVNTVYWLGQVKDEDINFCLLQAAALWLLWRSTASMRAGLPNKAACPAQTEVQRITERF